MGIKNLHHKLSISQKLLCFGLLLLLATEWGLYYLFGVSDQMARIDLPSSGLGVLRSGIDDIKTGIWFLGGVLVIGMPLLIWWVGRELRTRVAVACRFSDDVRVGNLTTLIHDPRTDEFTPLIATMRDMQEALTKIVTKVRMGAEEVSLASDEISQANTDLSQRTELQALSLRNASAAMENISENANQIGEKSGTGNTLAQESARAGTDGIAAFSSVQHTMQAISKDSGRALDIISIIDGIAFQTHILALNAAVEAARAGEHGRGFAVVASEVQTLAKRSASAAKEIKELLTSSNMRVGSGVALVQGAGEQLGGMTHAVSALTHVISDIAQSSQSQLEVVGGMVATIDQIDQTTQQNAALVEQTAAASQQLRTQAARLVESVQVFRLNGSPREAQEQVQGAVDLISRVGPEKAYQEFTHGTSFKDRDLYITVYDFNGRNLAHGANSNNVGKVLIDMKDANGVEIIKNSLRIARESECGWSPPYHILNPVTQKTMAKKAYVQRVGETFVSSGIYIIDTDR
ncbi:MAG: methyl-accepting chemotaxis protein [Rhodoferax sp.]